MQPITREELWSLPEYEKLRPGFRKEIVSLKESRRVDVGKYVTLLFMNRDLVRSQVMEMCRIENLTRPEDVDHELMTYNGLIPPPGGVSATIFISAPEGVAGIRPMLDSLVGLNEHVALKLGEDRIPGEFDEAQFEEDRISAVQYVRFRLTPEQSDRLSRGDGELFVVIDHPNYSHRAWVNDAVRASLQADVVA